VCSLSVSANDPPQAKFTINPDRGPAPLDVTLNASASVDPDGRIEHYNWSADGNTTAGKRASMTFETSGDYNIQLVVIDELGASDTAHQTVIVIDPAPEVKADFSVTPKTGTEPLKITLNASASTGNITDYEWSITSGVREKNAFGKKATSTLTAGTYTIALTVTTSEGETDSYQYPKTIVVDPKPVEVVETPVDETTDEKVVDPKPVEVEETPDDETTDDKESDASEASDSSPTSYNSTARVRPQIIAAGVAPSKLARMDDHFDVVALIRPGVSRISAVSFQNTKGPLKLGMTRAGVLANGDEIYKLTLFFEPGSLGDVTFSTAWGSKPGQFNIVAMDKAQINSHTYPHLLVGYFPALPPSSVAKRPATSSLNYDDRLRASPQVLMAGYSPAIVDVGDSQFDVIAVIRPGLLPIEHVVLKQNEDGLFRHQMEWVAETDNGDQIYKMVYMYEPGSLATPGKTSEISYTDLWGPEAQQFRIEVLDQGGQRSHKFPDIEIGNFPELPR
jgi:PKD repeat protein